MARLSNGELWLSTYLCRAVLFYSMVFLSNGLGSPTFSEFRFSEQPSDTITVKDRPTVLPCSAHHDGTTPDIQWIKDDVYITPDNRRQILSNGSLYFQLVEHSRSHRPDEGIYQCAAAVLGLGTIVSKKAKLQIASLNKVFNEEPESLSVHLRDTAMFACDIGGAPPPTVHWYKDELEIDTQNVNYHIHIGGVLEIRSVQFAEFGRYRCKAENPERSRLSEVAELTQDSNVDTYQGVQPHFVMEPKNTVAVEGDITMLFCAANGRDRQEQPPTITWLKDGVTIDMSNLDTRFSLVGQGSLRVDSINEGDSGSYTCRATNMEDSVDSDITLTVQVPPKFRKRPKSVFAQVHTTVEFECDIYGVPKPQITWLKNGEIVVPSDYFLIVDGRNLRILGLVKSDAGMYQCAAENGVGNVQAGAQLSILQPGASVSPSPFPSLLTTPPHPSGVQNAASHSLPGRPQELTAAYVSTRFITLSWRQPENPGASDIDSYAVYWREEGSNREQMVNTTALEANIQHLKPNTRYEFRVLAHNGAGASSEVAQIMVQTEQEVHVPGPVENLAAMILSPTSIKLTWQLPSEPHGVITNYKLLYYEVGDPSGDEDLNTDKLEEVITGLKKAKQYSFRVVAYNSNGPGTSTEEILARTFSAVPDLPPQNVTIETDSSTSLLIRWEPPPEDAQNGIITGYKIRYKQRGARGGDTATTDGNRRVYELSDLEKGTEYSIRLQALTVNGSGPATSWLTAETYISDLEENTVPGKPTSLRVRSMTDSIVVSWTAPAEQDIMIRGYILGYGIRMPDVFRQVLDSKQRSHIIKNLQPSSEYVISLRAYNNIGEGLQIYETTFTREETTQEPQTPMIPPVGLKAIVLSSTTIVLTWSDTSLGRNQRIADNRFYTVRYNQKMARKFKYLNATDLNVHIDDLKPNTEYEFSVKVTKGRRKSTWSLSVFNKTLEDAPATAPRDLTPVPVQNKPTWVTLNWQPPRQPNGQVTGYLVYYSTDPNMHDRDWVVEGVMGGDRLSSTIRDLSSDTTYFFKVQARNSKGYGPMSPTVIFRTPKSDGTGGGMIETPDDIGRAHLPGQNDHYDQDGYGAYGRTTPGRKDEKAGPDGIPSLVLWISIGCVGGITLIAVLVVTIILCKRRNSSNSHKGYQPANKKGTPTKPGPKDLKPPDLWIHDNMELKNLEKSNADSQDGKSTEEPGERDRYEEERYHRNPLRPKPIMIPVDQPPPPREPIATAVPNGSLGSDREGPTPIRPVYPRTQYNTQYTSTPRVNAGDLPPTGSVRPQQQQPNSPYKKPSAPPATSPVSSQSRSPLPVVTPRAPDVTLKTSPCEESSDLPKSFSTEELTAEMANLEGLMKDLNAITQQEFEC